MRSRVRHELKTWPEFFAATRRGHKKFELRRDDRPEGFQVGDELLLREFVPPGRTIQAADEKTIPFQVGENGLYSGRELLVRVDYVMRADAINATVPEMGRPATLNEHLIACVLKPGFVIMSVSLLP